METYEGLHRATPFNYHVDENGMKLMVWSANHTSQYPIVKHSDTRKRKITFRPKHSYCSSWWKIGLLGLGINLFKGKVPASKYMTT